MPVGGDDLRGCLSAGREIRTGGWPEVPLLLSEEVGDRPAVTGMRNSTGQLSLHRLRIDPSRFGDGVDVCVGVRHGAAKSLVRHCPPNECHGPGGPTVSKDVHLILGRLGIRRTSLKVLSRGFTVPGQSAAMRWQEDESLAIQTSGW